MKNKIFSTAFLAAALLAGSCTKQLDTTPYNTIDQSLALKTSSDVEGLLVGAYGDMGAADVYGGGEFVTADLSGDFNEISFYGTYPGMTQIANKAIPVDNGFVERGWTGSYKAINDVNNVLSAVQVVTSAKRNRVEGEAKFIRGALYFDLVRLFAKAWNDGSPASNDGVPLKLTPTQGLGGAADQIPRNKVSEVYTQVIKDLTEAEAKLPATNSFFATKYSAAAMLARVYLQKGDYANARDAANRVIASGKYSLTQANADGIIEEFAYTSAKREENTTEDIFAIQVTTTAGVNTFQTFYSETGRGDIAVNTDHYNLYEANDLRLNLINRDDLSKKFDNVYGNVHIIRLAEMYLTRAEANFRLGTTVGAKPVDDVNLIRARAGLNPRLVVTLDNILKERKIELSFEGFTLHDVKRLAITTGYFTGGGGLAWNSPKLVFPIPKRDRLINPNLTQNTGY